MSEAIMRTEPLTRPGQIKTGDTIHCEFRGEIQQHPVKEVLNAGTSREEILINRKKNLYFITSMAIDGSSWAKNVRVESQLVATEWTPVSEPPGPELLNEKGWGIFLAFRPEMTTPAGQNGTVCYTRPFGWNDCSVTHWMPLPKPPEL